MFDKASWLEVADSLKPELLTETVRPVCGLPALPLSKGDMVILDFGNHHVGHFSMKLGAMGSHQDAPAFLRIKFCEVERELHEDAAGYNGWISKGWIQEEQLHVDVLPETVHMPRRYAFRFVKIEVIDVSSKYQLVIEDAWAECTTSADDRDALPFHGTPDEEKIDAVAMRTLRSCMQDVFEDGPKRDRRLWMGDLRLQALVNYHTYRRNDLVKRCLYLFAGTTRADDRIAGCLFTAPRNEADDTYMLDYSLFYIPTLLDYYEATGDMDTLRDLGPLALKQLDICAVHVDDRHLVRDSDQLGWCFVDWNLSLNKQASAQAIYIYCAKAAEKMAALLEMQDAAKVIHTQWTDMANAALTYLYDADVGLFVSGAERQVSIASQVWFVLSGILDEAQSRDLMKTMHAMSAIEGMVTPYMYHHYIEALSVAGMQAQAYETMMGYWGGMIAQGADTFFELFNPANPDESPYGSSVVNSYCHAWSCTPSWFLRSGRLAKQ